MSESDHFLSRFSSSEAARDQSSVAQSSEEEGTGCSDAVPTEGLKSMNSAFEGVCGSERGVETGKGDLLPDGIGDTFAGVVCVVDSNAVEPGSVNGLWPLSCCSTAGLYCKALRSSARIFVSSTSVSNREASLKAKAADLQSLLLEI